MCYPLLTTRSISGSDASLKNVIKSILHEACFGLQQPYADLLWRSLLRDRDTKELLCFAEGGRVIVLCIVDTPIPIT